MIRFAEDKSIGHLNHGLCATFNEAVNDLGIMEFPLLDHLYTWSNERANPTLAWQDRAFVNPEQCSAFPNNLSQVNYWALSWRFRAGAESTTGVRNYISPMVCRLFRLGSCFGVTQKERLRQSTKQRHVGPVNGTAMSGSPAGTSRKCVL